MRALVLALLLAAGGAKAEGLPDVARLVPWSELSAEKPGTWVEYALLVGGHPTGPYLRFTAGEPGWIEVWVSQRPGSATQAWRLRLAGGRIVAAESRLLGGPVRTLGPGELQDEAKASGTQAPLERRFLGAEPLLTGAGTLQTRVVELWDREAALGKAWLAEVPLFGLARLELATGVGLELQDAGSGGRSVFPNAR